MTKEADDFRMGVMLDHEHSMELLQLALAKDLTPQEVIFQLIDMNWVFLKDRIK